MQRSPNKDPASRASVSLILPVHNEERVLEATLDRIEELRAGLDRELELICVDDGSRDGSRALLRRRRRAGQRLELVQLPEQQGKGAAVRAGVLAATGEHLVQTDADLSCELTALRPMLELLDSGVQLVYGDRRDPASRILRHQPFWRENLGRGFAALARRLVLPGVRDFTCGFKGFEAELARRIFALQQVKGWAWDVEVLARAAALGARLAPLPVVWSHCEGSKVRMPAAILEAGADLLRINRLLRAERAP